MKIDYITGLKGTQVFDKEYPFKLIRVNSELKLNKEAFARYNEEYKLQMFIDEFKRTHPNDIKNGSVLLANFIFVLIADDKFNKHDYKNAIMSMKETIIELNEQLARRYGIQKIGIDKKLLGLNDKEFSKFIEILEKELGKTDLEFIILLDEE